MAQAHPGHDEQEDASQPDSWNLEPLDGGEESDHDLEAWLRQWEVDLEEQRFALADRLTEGW